MLSFEEIEAQSAFKLRERQMMSLVKVFLGCLETYHKGLSEMVLRTSKEL